MNSGTKTLKAGYRRFFRKYGWRAPGGGVQTGSFRDFVRWVARQDDEPARSYALDWLSRKGIA